MAKKFNEVFGWDAFIIAIAEHGIFNKPNMTPYESAFYAPLHDALVLMNIKNEESRISSSS